jgi:hypothetical protein
LTKKWKNENVFFFSEEEDEAIRQHHLQQQQHQQQILGNIDDQVRDSKIIFSIHH